MKTEKIIVSFVSVFFGLLVAGIAFYFYQGAKTVTPTKLLATLPSTTPTPTPIKSTAFITVDNPNDETIVTSGTINISGKTRPGATIVIVTPIDQQVVTSTKDGSFSATTTISDGENQIDITAINPDGSQATAIRTVSFTT